MGRTYIPKGRPKVKPVNRSRVNSSSVDEVVQQSADAAAGGSGVFDTFANGSRVKNTAPKGKDGKTASTYGNPNDADWAKAEAWHGGGGGGDKSVWKRTGQFMGNAGGTLKAAAMEEGRTVLGMAGSHAIRGAAFGGLAGGTIEAAQGGSFWDGAKQGAFNGAVGWTGYRMGMKAVGAKSMNPFAKDGIGGSANTMWRSLSHDKEVSGQAVAILNNRQMEGVARNFMNQRKNGK